MGKDLNTTIVGVIAGIAIILNWVMSFFNIDFQVPAQVQVSIVGICVVVIGWYTGKKE
jgi:hypothetical protein